MQPLSLKYSRTLIPEAHFNKNVSYAILVEFKDEIYFLLHFWEFVFFAPNDVKGMGEDLERYT